MKCPTRIHLILFFAAVFFAFCSQNPTSSNPAPKGVDRVFASANSSSAVTVGWNSVDSATRYEVKICSSSAKITVHTDTISDTTMEYKGLIPGTQYYFQVRVFYKDNFSAYSDYVHCSTPQWAGISAETASSSSIHLYWQKVQNAFQYTIHCKSPTSGSFFIAGTSVDTFGYHHNLLNNTEYSYYVEADSGSVLRSGVVWESPVVTAKTFPTEWESLGDTTVLEGGASYVSVASSQDIPYVAYSDSTQNGKLTVKKYQNNQWSTVGSPGISTGKAIYISLKANNGMVYVAYQDETTYKTYVKKFDGASWVNLGSGVSSLTGDQPCLSVYNNTPYVAYVDNGFGMGGTVKKFNGTDWVMVGTVFGTNLYSISLDVENDTLFVAYSMINMFAFTGVQVSKFNGTRWVTLGDSALYKGGVEYVSLTVIDGVPHVAYPDEIYEKLNCKKLVSGSWVFVGAENFTPGSARFLSMCEYGGAPYIAFRDAGKYGSVRKFGGNGWNSVGGARFTQGYAKYTSLCIENGTAYFAYSDESHGNRLTILKYSGL